MKKKNNNNKKKNAATTAVLLHNMNLVNSVMHVINLLEVKITAQLHHG
jgi:hypothetical protein